jgi:predicted outer membrane repeat protein
MNFSNSQGSVKNSFITENSADWGGGIYFYGNNNLTFQNVSIFGNTAVSGGGIYVTTIEVNAVEMWDINEPYEGIIFNESLISFNEAEAGGGIYITGNGNFSLENSTVIGNGAFGGGGVYVESGSPYFCNVVFNENTVNPDSGDGSVMMLYYGSNPELMNVTISGNYQYASLSTQPRLPLH